MKTSIRTSLVALCLFCTACDPASIFGSDDDSDDSVVQTPLDRFAQAYAQWWVKQQACHDDGDDSVAEFDFSERVEGDHEQAEDPGEAPRSEAEVAAELKEDFEAPHVSYDVDTMKTCTDLLESFLELSCQELDNMGGTQAGYDLTSCFFSLVSGTLGDGEACEENLQCEDGVCGDQGDGCECVSYVAIGEDCAASDVGCNFNDGYCGPSEEGGFVCTPWVELGDACDEENLCRIWWGATCVDGVCQLGADDDGEQSLVNDQPGAEGEACGLDGEDFCSGDLICDDDSRTCIMGPGVGEACLDGVLIECGEDDDEDCQYRWRSNKWLTCALGLMCEWDSDTCVMPAQEGENCEDVECAQGLDCNWQTKLCETVAELGENCEDKTCADDLYCDRDWGNGDNTCKAIPKTKSAGDSCDADEWHACGEDGIDSHGLACVVDDDGDGTCQQASIVDEGGACNNNDELNYDGEHNADKWCKYSYSTHYCHVELEEGGGEPIGDSGVCTRRPGAGAPCTAAGECDESVAACLYKDENDEWIDDEDRECVALPQAGEPCLDDAYGPSCSEDAWCDYDLGEDGECVADDDDTSGEAMCMDLTE